MTSIKLITPKYATLTFTQKTQHPFHNVGRSQIQFYAQKYAAAPVEFTTSDDRAVLTPPPLQAPVLRAVLWTDVASSLEI